MTERQYKDSGIEWIGEVPSNWDTMRIKDVIVRSKDGIKIGPFGSALTGKTVSHGNYYVYSQYNLINDDFSDTKNKITDDTFNTLKAYEVLPNDICLSMMGTIGKCKTVPSNIKKGIMDSHLIKIRLNERMIDKYFEYVYDKDYSGLCYKQMQIDKTGSIMDGLNTTIIKNLYLPVPPLEEQQQIADFLDAKTASINSAIQTQKDIVEKLKEYRQSVITEAVTKGLNPDAKMKNIDFLWVHEFPENWGIYKLNHLLDYNHPYPLGDGDHGSIKAKDYATCGIPLFRVQNLGYAESINTDNLVYISKAQNETIKNSTLYPDDILFAKTGSIGKTAILTGDTPIANTTSHIGKITVNKKKFFPRYVYYFLSSEIGIFQLWDIASKKATRPEVGLDEVKYIKFLIPNSIAEQKAISDYLDAQCNRIANAISHCNAIIEKLEEYKKSIIYSAVTGKIDCRKDVIPE